MTAAWMRVVVAGGGWGAYHPYQVGRAAYSAAAACWLVAVEAAAAWRSRVVAAQVVVELLLG